MNRRAFINPHFLVAATILGLSAGALNVAISTMNIHLRKLPIEPASGLRLHTLPVETESWRRQGSDPPPLSAEALEELGTQNYISRTYVEKERAEGQPRSFELHCAYYTGMIDPVPHVPERCFVGGGGMQIDGSVGVVTPVALNMDRFAFDPTVDTEIHGVIRRGRTGPYSETPGVRVRMPRELENLRLNVTRFVDSNGTAIYAGYFFIANGGIVPRAEQVRLLAFRHEDKYAYYMKVQFTSMDVSSPAEMAELAASFLDEMLPELMLRAPDWIDVVEGRGPASAGSQTEGASPVDPGSQG